VLASTTAVILGALVLVRYASAPMEEVASDEPIDRLEQAADVASHPEPMPAVPPPAAMTVAPAGMVAAPVVDDRPAAPVVKAQPKKITVKVVRPGRSRLAASMKTPVKSTTKPTAPAASTSVANLPARGEVAATHAPALSASAESVGPPPVTLTGCLEISADRDAFRLTDTDGVDAPKARSWRTGFLAKRPTPVALVEAPDPRGLQREVGKRVAATGMLIDRELKVSSVSVVGSSCEQRD
jgi:hypothetical protein